MVSHSTAVKRSGLYEVYEGEGGVGAGGLPTTLSSGRPRADITMAAADPAANPTASSSSLLILAAS